MDWHGLMLLAMARGAGFVVRAVFQAQPRQITQDAKHGWRHEVSDSGQWDIWERLICMGDDPPGPTLQIARRAPVRL